MAGSILVVDDIATNRVVMKAKLALAFHQTVLAEDGAQALAEARRVLPELILLDYGLPDMSGVEVLRKLRADPPTRRIPVIVISASPLVEDRLAALAAGAEDFFIKPVEDRVLLARIRNLLRLQDDLREETGDGLHLAEEAAPFAAPSRIALVTEGAATADALCRMIETGSRDRTVTLTREAALSDQAADGVDVLIVDAAGGGPQGGLSILSDLRSRGERRHAGICVWHDGALSADLTGLAYDMGADDVLTAAMSVAEIRQRLRGVMSRRREVARLRAGLRDRARLADVDPLTGLWNRRYAEPRLEAMARAAARTGAPLAVMLLDLDRFKSVNDTCGHAAGDAVLTEVAARLRRAAPEALVARWGGEEFLIAMAGLAAGPARDLAEALCAAVNARVFTLPDLPPVAVTASVGLALAAQDELPGATLARADAALYRSKLGGRNQVTVGRSA